MHQDVVTFTGSATTGRMLKAHPRIIDESVPFNMEADSLNAIVLGPDAVPAPRSSSSSSRKWARR
jgi:oxepin-CoA hydrolase/3-oxo-5,6-dehydrosuberyl-CoA semialdehyde dehydrogenase